MAKLLLFDGLDAGIRGTASYVGQIWNIGAGDLRAVKSLKEFAAALHQQKELEEVVFYFHGIPGGITIGGETFFMSDKKLKDALTAKQSTIRIIRFEGCWVGEKPDEMWQFGTYFKASQVFGFTWMGIRGHIEFTLPKGTDVAGIRKTVKHAEKWIAPGSPTLDAIASKAKDRDVKEKMMTEFFQYTTGGEVKPPWKIEPNETKTNFEKLGSHTYKRRKEAEEIAMTAKQAMQLAEGEETNITPLSLFKYVKVAA